MAAPKGNQYARKAHVWTNAIKRSIARHGEGDWRKGLDQLADKMVKAADKGDQWALNHIADRIEGKTAETVHIEQRVHFEEVSGRTLSGTLRALGDSAETPQPAVRPDPAGMGPEGQQRH